jgi:hypothetical protein
MRRVHRCGHADYIPTRRFRFILLLDLPLGLKPVPQRSAVGRTFVLQEVESPRLDPSFAFVLHGQPSPKNDRTAITTTTRPTR